MLRELSALKKISHPNINEVINISYNNFKLYLLFPYVEISLNDILYLHTDSANNNNNNISSFERKYALKFLYQLLDAICYCHERRIVHRNLKVMLLSLLFLLLISICYYYRCCCYYSQNIY